MLKYKSVYDPEEYEVRLTACWYQMAKQMRIQMFDTDGCPVMTITSCDPSMTLYPGQILVKNYTENEGVLDWLIANELIDPKVVHFFGVLHLCSITDKMIEVCEGMEAMMT